MNARQAKRAITDFVRANSGQRVYFDALDNHGRMVFVLVQSFIFFGFLSPADRLKRAIENTEAQAKSGYLAFSGGVLNIAKK